MKKANIISALIEKSLSGYWPYSYSIKRTKIRNHFECNPLKATSYPKSHNQPNEYLNVLSLIDAYCCSVLRSSEDNCDNTIMRDEAANANVAAFYKRLSHHYQENEMQTSGSDEVDFDEEKHEQSVLKSFALNIRKTVARDEILHYKEIRELIANKIVSNPICYTCLALDMPLEIHRANLSSILVSDTSGISCNHI